MAQSDGRMLHLRRGFVGALVGGRLCSCNPESPCCWQSRSPFAHRGQGGLEQAGCRFDPCWQAVAARLRREFDLPLSHKAIQRIWRAHSLIQKRRRKYQRKQHLARSKPPGGSSSKSPPKPRIYATCPTMGSRPSAIASRWCSTPPARSTVACCSCPSPPGAAAAASARYCLS